MPTSRGKRLRPFGRTSEEVPVGAHPADPHTGLVSARPALVSEGTTGWEHLRPEDTLDADYGRVLERAYAASAPTGKNNVKGLASPTGFETVCTVERERLVSAA